MNKGMPNAAKLSAYALTQATGLGSVLGWILNSILTAVLGKAIQKGLVILDKGHIAIIVPVESKKWDGTIDEAYEIVDQGNVLTQEEKDEIDKPTMDAFIDFATFRLRRRNKNT